MLSRYCGAPIRYKFTVAAVPSAAVHFNRQMNIRLLY